MIAGIVAAKKGSKRFPNKNIFEINGKPMFWHSVQPMIDSCLVDDIYVVTDSSYIKKYCENRNVNVIWRNVNACHPDDKLINIIRFVYYSIPKEYDIIVSIMANCPGHTALTVDKSINVLLNNKLKEVRSFNNLGEESGIAVYSKELMKTNADVSYYMGASFDTVNEIHFEADLSET